MINRVKNFVSRWLKGRSINPGPVPQRRVIGAVTIGAYSYGLTAASFRSVDDSVPITIGKFCSFADEVRIFGRSEHPTDRVSTFPLRTLLFDPGTNRDATTRGPVVIGNDVWVGAYALIMSGVTIGHGAVIGAGSIVTRDVPPYGIAVGAPARTIRHRFESPVVEALLAIKWWDWPIEKIRAFEQEFYGPVEAFIARARQSGN
jgi:acetyltransferase-like isoleucine patch superfamily enzyme